MRAMITGALLAASGLALADERGDEQPDLIEMKEQQDWLSERVEKLRPLERFITGYVDVGFFAVGGDGSGIRSDVGHQNFPEFDGVIPGSWVFMGDPLSTAVNSRGEPASLGTSRAIQFDSLDTDGGPSFAINAIGLELSAGISERTLLTTAFDLVPRNRDVSDPDGHFLGDFVDIKRAYVQYQPRLERRLLLVAGKFHSVIGSEYGAGDAPSRVTVTPSLICRYTCGNPIGLKARAYFLDDKLNVTAALTNGSHFVSSFPFNDEIDANAPLTGAARIAYEERLPLNGDEIIIDVGVSGAVGPQDGQRELDVLQWQYALDLRAEYDDWILTAQYVEGDVEGQTSAMGPACDLTECLDFRGAFGMLAYYPHGLITPYLRVDWRDSLHRSGVDFVYISELMRATVGTRFDINTRVIAKVEYTFNRELGRIPEFSDDVFASSLILEY